MKKTDDLFLLIQSMSKSEKRYFKLYAARHTAGEKNNYLKLFEYIARQNNYDEAQIKNEFKAEKFTENFFAIKKYLFDVILSSLVDYNKEKLISHKLYEDISKIKILIYKGLKKSALKLSEKSLETAKAHSQHFIIQELLQLQSEKILLSESVFNDKKMKAISEEKFRALDELISQVQYSALYGRVHSSFIKTPVASSSEEIKELEWLTLDPLFIDESNAKGYSAKEDLLQIKSFYYWFSGNYNKSLEYRKRKVLLMDDYPVIKETQPVKYILAIHSYLMYGWFELSHKECEEYLTKLKFTSEKLFHTSKDESQIKNVFMVLFVLEVLWFERNNEAGKIFKKLDELEEQLTKFTGKLETPKLLDIYSATGAALFRMGYYDNSLSLTNIVLNHKDVKMLETLYHVNLVRAIVIHYELKNYDLIEYLTKALTRINKKNKRRLASEKDLITTINKLFKITSKEESKNILGEFKYSIEKLFQSSMLDKIFILRMGLLNWINKKLEKTN